MNIFFDIQHLYYLPQYLPVFRQLKKLGAEVQLLCYRSSDDELQAICNKVISDLNMPAIWIEGWSDALTVYLDKKPDWIVFGNSVKDLDKLHAVSKTAMMGHGIGPKSCYYDVSKEPTTVRFVEGQHRLKRLKALYPDSNFVDTGYAKLDAAFDNTENNITLEQLGLDPSRPTILYAPTFYPSSIEKFSKSFPKDFSDYNIIIKPHFFTLTKAKYKKQRNRLSEWVNSENVYLASTSDYNLMPFMAIADIMLSDASSAIFEFAALNKPVVWCDFYQLRWTYRGPFSLSLIHI